MNKYSSHKYCWVAKRTSWLWLGIWHSGSTLVSIKQVNLRRARLVLGLVTLSGFNSLCVKLISISNQRPRSAQPGYPSVGGTMSTSHTAVTPRGRGLKAGMVRAWLAGKTAWFPCYTIHGPYLSTLEIKGWYIKHYINWSVFYFTKYILIVQFYSIYLRGFKRPKFFLGSPLNV